MAVDEPTLSQSHTLISLPVYNSTSISSRVSAILAKFDHTIPSETPGRPVIVILRARAKAGSKLISIVEIAKRDLRARARPCFQYTELTSEAAPPSTHDNGADLSDSDDAFQAMPRAAANVEPPAARSVPVLTVYLCAESVASLKAAVGEQR